MIVERDMAAQSVVRSWDLSPNRSLDLRGLLTFFALVAAASLAVSSYSFSQGNAFAPAFALAELALLAVCLRLVWRRLARRERLALTGDGLLVEAGGRSERFHPYWVRVRRDGAGGVRLRSHGREIEVGAFLCPRERDQLAASLRAALAPWQR
ncbi:MAG: DUF2244 domain-containing protein [Xanthomonadales bacterium]|nr:DUF2244 domain-containing protein [Xanthomonadales bacterium]